MSFNTEILREDLQVNVVVKIDGVYYAQKQPDSGLVIDSDKVIVDDGPNVNGTKVDVRNVKTPIGSFSFKLLEHPDDPTLSSTIMRTDGQWLGKDVVAYMGFINGSFDFSEYQEIARTQISTVTKVANGYSFISKEVTNLVNQEALNRNDVLQTALIPASTTLDIVDASDWPDTGVLFLNGEFMGWTSKDTNTLQNLQRGLYGTTATDHELGSEVYQVTLALSVNPITLMLQMMLSNTGDGSNHPTYDVLDGGLNISPDDIDIAKYETIRDEFFVGELHDYYIYDNDKVIKFFEQTTLISTNTRLVTFDGKISLALLDQVDFEDETIILDESSIKGVPTFKLDDKKIVNRVEVSYNYNVATRQYESMLPFEDADSIATFGLKKPLKLKFKGVTTTLNGDVICADRANRLLARLSTARGFITATVTAKGSALQAGGNVQLVHRYLPQQGGTLGFSDRVEVMSRDVNLNDVTVKLGLEFTSYTGIRLAFIAPSPRITNVISQNQIEVDDASCLRKGYVMRLFKDGADDIEGNPTIGSYLPDDANVIQSIDGNIVTMTDDFVSTLGTDIVLKFADYDNASEEQRARYGFIGENSGFFNDGSKVYQIIF
jgi:hypothetical protein